MVTIRKAHQDDAELLTGIGMRAWRKASRSRRGRTSPASSLAPGAPLSLIDFLMRFHALTYQ